VVFRCGVRDRDDFRGLLEFLKQNCLHA
jgi:hypothetical protein